MPTAAPSITVIPATLTLQEGLNVHLRTLVLLRVAAYARVSCGKEAMLHSLSAQVSYYSQLIQSTPGWVYAGVYADEALTGTKQDRPEFQRLLADCRAGKIDLILTNAVITKGQFFSRWHKAIGATVRASLPIAGKTARKIHKNFIWPLTNAHKPFILLR